MAAMLFLGSLSDSGFRFRFPIIIGYYDYDDNKKSGFFLVKNIY